MTDQPDQLNWTRVPSEVHDPDSILKDIALSRALRARVPGGWLYTVGYKAQALTFVPDLRDPDTIS